MSFLKLCNCPQFFGLLMAFHPEIAAEILESDDEEFIPQIVQDFSIYSISNLNLYKSTRLTRPTFLLIKRLIENNLKRKTRRSSAFTVDLQLFVALQFFASGGFQWLVGNTLNISQASASRIIRDVTDSLVEVTDQFIKFPAVGNYADVKQNFYNIGQRGRLRCGFPNVLGVIDCTHIRLQKPSSNPEQYVDRFFHHSINVQLVCGPNLEIFNVLAAYPGGNHDSYIWRNSALRASLLEGNFLDGWFVGDSGYPQENWLMTPVANPRTHAEELYNSVHIVTRNPIERCNGVLKSRFRCLAATGDALVYCPARVCAITIACCVLHNISLQQGERMDIDEDIQRLIIQEQAQPQRQGGVINDDVRNRLIRDRFNRYLKIY